ncbi:MAG: serine/threonine protein kinase [Phycisphaerales bacterium]|nr:serine/threonine protein kinase [Phycisphaerae bacterium]NNF43321.1 serine/threonine protein kinase [Phycisphaerales bacterium]NNM25560.1 serine/threonine protein kinase [Phycisphaerales bacterium]
MTAAPLSLAIELERLYRASEGDPPFAEVLRHLGAEVAADVADVIEADGRRRLREDLPLDLERYLAGVPDLTERTDALDAAIDMALRALARSGRADEDAVDALARRHPELTTPIREAAVLNNALWSTTRLQSHVAMPRLKSLPCGFGPPWADAPRYELIEVLGTGAFGQVYLAIDRKLSDSDHSALVSIKVLPATDPDSWARQRGIDEATKARRIEHPNVVRVLDRGTSGDDEDYIVYEYVDGGDLGKWARRQHAPLALTEATRLIAAISRGVHAAHMAGLVHCDLKPNNVVLTADGTPKVADFGVAIRTGDVSTGPAGEPNGNLAFMSPEQFRTEPHALTIPTDVYALGGMLFWLVTGKLPNGDSANEIEIAHSEPGPAFASPRLIRPAVDRDLEAIIRRGLAPRPGARYASAAALAADLEAWQRREPLTWTRPPVIHRFKLWTRRRPGLAIASALIMLLAGFGGRATYLASMQRRANEVAQGRVGVFRNKLVEATKAGLGHQVLTPLWLAEWLYGPTVLGLGDARFELWELRVTVVQDLLARAEASGTGRTFETLIWKSSLGYWLVEGGDADAARPVLADAMSLARELLPPGDPFHEDLAAMDALADLADPASESLVHDPIGVLAVSEARLDRLRPGAPLHRLILKGLIDAHRERGGDAPALERYAARYAELTD